MVMSYFITFLLLVMQIFESCMGYPNFKISLHLLLVVRNHCRYYTFNAHKNIIPSYMCRRALTHHWIQTITSLGLLNLGILHIMILVFVMPMSSMILSQEVVKKQGFCRALQQFLMDRMWQGIYHAKEAQTVLHVTTPENVCSTCFFFFGMGGGVAGGDKLYNYTLLVFCSRS